MHLRVFFCDVAEICGRFLSKYATHDQFLYIFLYIFYIIILYICYLSLGDSAINNILTFVKVLAVVVVVVVVVVVFSFYFLDAVIRAKLGAE